MSTVSVSATRDRLKQAIKDSGGVARWAPLLGCSEQFLYMLFNGSRNRKPGRALAVRIEKEFGIEPGDWDLPSASGKAA